MAALTVMNEPLVARVVNYLIAQRRVPSLRSGHTTPTRLAEAQETREKRTGPHKSRAGSGQKAGASVSQFRRHRFIKGLPWFGQGIDPECERSRFDQAGDGLVEAWRVHCSESLDGTRRLGSMMCQGSSGKNL